MKKKMILLPGLILFSLFVGVFVFVSLWIGYEVAGRCELARRDYDGDCVESLVKQLDDETESFQNRNSAIWALGQLGDQRATNSLEKYYTGNIPDREPLGDSLSQYELKKALYLTRGGFNIASFLWRQNFLLTSV